MNADNTKTMQVEPKGGRTIRFAAGHARQGERIPEASETHGGRGTKVPLSAYYVRACNVGDLQLVKGGRRATQESVPAPPAPPKKAKNSSELSKMKKGELVELAEKNGIEASGTAADIRERLDAVNKEG